MSMFGNMQNGFWANGQKEPGDVVEVGRVDKLLVLGLQNVVDRERVGRSEMGAQWPGNLFPKFVKWK